MSPWSIGMLSDKENFKNTKQQHLYEFPRSIQERLYNIESTGMKEDNRQAFCIQRRKSYLLRRIPLYVVK